MSDLITSDEFADCIIAALSENPEQLKGAFFVLANLKATAMVELTHTEDMEAATLALCDMARALHDRLHAIVPVDVMVEMSEALANAIMEL
jgi:methyl coenzyme M reductase beta subunit